MLAIFPRLCLSSCLPSEILGDRVRPIQRTYTLHILQFPAGSAEADHYPVVDMRGATDATSLNRVHCELSYHEIAGLLTEQQRSNIIEAYFGSLMHGGGLGRSSGTFLLAATQKWRALLTINVARNCLQVRLKCSRSNGLR